ncbi:MAG: CBS domain-containing protein [Burkholderiales bacterium]
MRHRPVREIIENRRTLMASVSVSVSEAARLMKKHKAGAIGVGEHGHLVGVFTERDMVFRVVAEGRDPSDTRVGDVMTRNPQTIDPDKPFEHALHIMYEGGFRHVPVVEDDGRLIGMVSARDALGPELREFADELDTREHIGEIL